MALSRRDFVRTLGIGGAGALSTAMVIGRGREALAWGPEPVDAGLPQAAGTDQQIVISSNENPRGPGKAALDAIRGRTSRSAATGATSRELRYPRRSRAYSDRGRSRRTFCCRRGLEGS